MLQFDLQFYEELTVAWVRTVKFISGAFFWPTGQLVFYPFVNIPFYKYLIGKEKNLFSRKQNVIHLVNGVFGAL